MKFHRHNIKAQRLLLHISVALLLVTIFYIEFSFSNNICTAQQDCTKCIQKPDCVWCKNPEFEEANHPQREYPRCNTLQEHRRSTICSQNQYLENPQSKTNDIRTRARSNNGEEIHIQPEGIKAELRVGQPITFNLTYTEADDKPLDLYYIMDLSATMDDDKATVASQGGNLAVALQQITKDVQIGFGSFIDKPVMPFVSSSQLKGDVKERGRKVVIPYGFRNHLNLTKNIDQFKTTVTDAQISANLDAPEGGLDAIMQAISCDRIGWRSSARKLIVLATDGPFHIAGDGKLGGIVRPNDGVCHMEKDTYTHSTILDYPSVAQLNSKVLEKQAYLIFAVSDHLPIYKQLSQRITNSAAAELTPDSDNVVQLVRNEYQKISQRVQIMSSKELPFLRISYMADCENNGRFVKTDRCENVQVGKSVQFSITVELERCPKEQEMKGSKVEIEFSTFDLKYKENLKAELTIKCNCDCMNSGPVADSGNKCNKHGELKCGQCQCVPEYQGRNCECSKADEGTLDEAPCTSHNGTKVCSDRGKCECRVCQCLANSYGGTYTGKYCQYDDAKCRSGSSSNELCSKRGRCENEKCICQPGFSGDFCQCTTDSTTCLEPGSTSKDACSGNGQCSCTDPRKCVCKQNYGGLYCQKCLANCGGSDTRKASRCGNPKLKECIKCHLDKFHQKDPKSNTKCEQKECLIEKTQSGGGRDIESFDVSLMESISERDEDTKCTMKYGDKCEADFLYSYNDGARRYILNVVVLTSVTCKEDAPIFWYVVAVIAGVLLIGIFLLLLWKILTHIHDKREYSRFEEERAGAKWGTRDNPLYAKPTSDFENPAYQK